MLPYLVFNKVIKPEDAAAFAAEPEFEKGHILGHILSYVGAAANSQYNFDVKGIEGPRKISVKEGCPWGSDFQPGVVVCKLTAVATLKDAEKGGDLSIRDLAGQAHLVVEAREVGTVIVFPSILNYRFTDVKEGERVLAVCHFVGPCFR